MNKYEFEAIMEKSSFNEKIELIIHLGDVFESYNKEIEDFDDIIQILIDYLVASNDEQVIDEIIEAICKAQIYQNTNNVNFDKIEANLIIVEEKFLPRYIDILSYTHNKKYLPSILRFRDSNNIHVKQAIADALVEFGVALHEDTK